MPSLARAAGAAGATIRVASSVPAATIDPVTIADAGGLVDPAAGRRIPLRSIGPDLVLQPALAESWKPNDNGSVWTFKLRKGVKFHSGGEMKADDVVASIDRLADPANSSNALSVFTGILQKGATKKVDDYTVEFHLDAPNGNFPYMLSSDNYNAVIIPASYEGDYEKSFDGTGPFKLEKYTPKVGASFVRNDDYWGQKALPDRTEFTFFADMQPQILALQGGQVDIINQMPVLAGVALLSDPNVDIISLKSVAHQQVHMRCDSDPFKDPRVRRAIALSLDRDKLVAGPDEGPRRDRQRQPVRRRPIPRPIRACRSAQQDIAQAKQLMEAAGAGKGFKVTLTTERYLEIPEYAQLIQNGVKEIGIDLELNILDQGAYYGRRGVRQIELAGFGDGHHRLWSPRRAERLPRRAAEERRHLERGALQEQGLRHAGDQLHRRPRPRSPEGDGRQDPEAAARGNAGHLRLFLRLPDGDDEEASPACSRPRCRSCSSPGASMA